MRIRWPRLRRGGANDLTCQEAVALMTAYLDQALVSTDHHRLERHLDDCPHCREHLKQIEATILVSGAVRTEDLDPLAREDLMEVYRRWRAEGGLV
jgi:anti-sigma factor RsiW